MPNTKTILVGTDFSEFSRRAERSAGMLGAVLGCDSIELLTVKEAGLPDALAVLRKSTPAVAEAVLADRALGELRLTCGQLEDNHGIPCTSTVKFGRPEQEIVARAEELSATLTIIGAHGGNLFTDLFLGNTADKVARMSKTPVLLVRNEATQPYRQVLVPVDFSESSRRAALKALEIAPDAEINFLHVFDVILEEQLRSASIAEEILHDYQVKAGEDARRDLNQFIENLPADRRSVSRAVAFGYPGHVISGHAQSIKPDLIVVGKHGKSRFEELLLGSVSRHVLEQCFCDVLIT